MRIFSVLLSVCQIMELAENLKIGHTNKEDDCKREQKHTSSDENPNKNNSQESENVQLCVDHAFSLDNDESSDIFRRNETKKREHSNENDLHSGKDTHKFRKLNCDYSSNNSCSISYNDTVNSTICSNLSNKVRDERSSCDTSRLPNNPAENVNSSCEVTIMESGDLKNAKEDDISKIALTKTPPKNSFSPSTSNFFKSSEEVSNSNETEENLLPNDDNNLLDSSSSSGSSTSSSSASSSSSSSSSSLSSLFSFEEDEDDIDLVFNEGVSSDDEPNSESIESMVPSVLKKTLPADKFLFPREILLRQINSGDSKRREFSKFDTKVYASRRMVQRLELYRSLKKHEDCVNTVSFNDTGDLLISAANDRHVCLWNWAKSKSLLYFNTGHTANVYQAKFLPYSNDTQLITCGQDHQVRMCLLDESGLESTSLLTTHERAVHKISMQPQMPHSFLTAGEDGIVNAIDVRENNTYCKKLLKPSRQRLNPSAIVRLYSIHCNPVNNYEFIVSGNCEEIRMYDQRNISKKKQNPVKEFRVGRDLTEHDEFMYDGRSTTVTGAVYNYNGTEILASYVDNDIFLFNTDDTSRYVFRYDGHRNFATIKGVNFYGPRGEYIVSGSDCGYIYIWDKKSESIVQWMKGDKDIVNCLEPHPSFPILATSGLETEVKIWMPMSEGIENLTRRKDFQKVVKKNSYYKLAGPRDDLGVNLFYLLASARRS